MIRCLPVALLACAVVAAQPAEPKKLAEVVPGDCLAFVSLDVAKAWDHPALGGLRHANGEIEFAWAVQSALGIGPGQLERITAFWIPAGKETPLILMTGASRSMLRPLPRSCGSPAPRQQPLPSRRTMCIPPPAPSSPSFCKSIR